MFPIKGKPATIYLLEEIGSQHQNLRIGAETLYCAEIPNTLLMILGGSHYLQDIK